MLIYFIYLNLSYYIEYLYFIYFNIEYVFLVKKTTVKKKTSLNTNKSQSTALLMTVRPNGSIWTSLHAHKHGVLSISSCIILHFQKC